MKYNKEQIETELKSIFKDVEFIDDEFFVGYTPTIGDNLERILFLDKIKKYNKKIKRSNFFVRPKHKETK